MKTSLFSNNHNVRRMLRRTMNTRSLQIFNYDHLYPSSYSRPMHLQLPVMNRISFSKPSRMSFSSNNATLEADARAKARYEHISDIKDSPTSSASNEAVNVNNHQENKVDEVVKTRKLKDVPISEILQAKNTLRWVEPVVYSNSTLGCSIKICIENGLSGMMVIDDESSVVHNNPLVREKVVGMLTSRDLLRIINAGFQEGEIGEEIFQKTVGGYMTPITQVIYARPEDTVGTCRSIMAKLGVKCLPILSNGRVEGLVTARDISDYGLNATEKGGKKHALESISERVGLSSQTSMADPPAYLRAHLALQQKPLYMNTGNASLPHPFKTPDSCDITRRGYGPRDESIDLELSEDAHFVTRVRLPDETGKETRDVMYVGVADGVGSWREYGIDPRDFPRTLMQECGNILREAATTAGRKIQKGDEKFRRQIAPSEVMAQAYERVKADNIIGSCTACVAMFDGLRHQLHFSNLGDSGLIVLRHIDSTVAGALKRDRTKPRAERTSDLRIAFVSQQQLKSFNHPYQLGWTGEEICVQDTSFKNASESCTSSIHIRRGDIVIMATDGLFDNVELEDIAAIALEWEERNSFISNGDIAAREKRWESGGSMTNQSFKCINDLAEALVNESREKSLDSGVDSPFAILAKENDIMWSGGMPDDCTVIAMHVVGAEADVDG